MICCICLWTYLFAHAKSGSETVQLSSYEDADHNVKEWWTWPILLANNVCLPFTKTIHFTWYIVVFCVYITWSGLDTTLWSKSLVLTKDIESSCLISPLNNLPRVCYDTSQENKVLWRERFWLIEGEGGSSHRRPLGVKSWLVTGEVGGRGGRAGPQVRGEGGVESITPDHVAKIYAFIYWLLSSLKKILGEL